jgi:hypothetical protein
MGFVIKTPRARNGERRPMDSNLPQLEADAKQRILERTAMGVRVGLEALSLRLLSVLALVLNSIIVGWCLIDPRWERLVAVGVFAIFSYFVIHVKPKE